MQLVQHEIYLGRKFLINRQNGISCCDGMPGWNEIREITWQCQ